MGLNDCWSVFGPTLTQLWGQPFGTTGLEENAALENTGSGLARLLPMNEPCPLEKSGLQETGCLERPRFALLLETPPQGLQLWLHSASLSVILQLPFCAAQTWLQNWAAFLRMGSHRFGAPDPPLPSSDHDNQDFQPGVTCHASLERKTTECKISVELVYWTGEGEEPNNPTKENVEEGRKL